MYHQIALFQLVLIGLNGSIINAKVEEPKSAANVAEARTRLLQEETCLYQSK